MDEKKILIIQFNKKTEKWEDVTKDVQKLEDRGNACRIKYSGNDTFYWKSWDDLRIINKPLTVNIVGKIIFCDKVPVYGLREVIQFNSYFKLYYSSGYTRLEKSHKNRQRYYRNERNKKFYRVFEDGCGVDADRRWTEFFIKAIRKIGCFRRFRSWKIFARKTWQAR